MTGPINTALFTLCLQGDDDIDRLIRELTDMKVADPHAAVKQFAELKEGALLCSVAQLDSYDR